MTTEVEQALFYQIKSFLKQYNEGNWFEKADTNGDGYLINYEFSQFIINNFKDWNGQESNKVDIINQFWNQFDANRSASHIKEDGKDTNLRNINALDHDTEEAALKAAVGGTTAYKASCADPTGTFYVGDSVTFNPKVTDKDENDVEFTLKLANGSNGTITNNGKAITISAQSAGTYTFTAFVIVQGTIVSQITKQIEVKNRYSCNFTDDNGKTLSIDNVAMNENTSKSLNISLKDNKNPNGNVSVTSYDIKSSNESALQVTQSNGKLTLTAGEVDENTSVTVKVEATVGNTKVTTSFTVTIKNIVTGGGGGGGQNPTTDYKNSAKTISENTTWPETVGGYIGTGYNANIHTEFGMNTSGGIVFQDETTTKYYNSLVSTIQTKIKASCPTEYKALGGDAGIKKLVQAAWIMAYNSYNSSQENNTTNFITAVITNFKKMLSSIANSASEETAKTRLNIYTSHSSYADTSLTNDLPYYDVPGYGDDQKITYKDWSGSETYVRLNDTNDDPEYTKTMSSLLKRLQAKYSNISTNTIETLFKKAQYNALTVCRSNTRDCPYGTGANSGRVEDGDTKDWGGADSRTNDGNIIEMDELVQLTLYQFDKLLYNWTVNDYDDKTDASTKKANDFYDRISSGGDIQSIVTEMDKCSSEGITYILKYIDYSDNRDASYGHLDIKVGGKVIKSTNVGFTKGITGNGVSYTSSYYYDYSGGGSSGSS